DPVGKLITVNNFEPPSAAAYPQRVRDEYQQADCDPKCGICRIRPHVLFPFVISCVHCWSYALGYFIRARRLYGGRCGGRTLFSIWTDPTPALTDLEFRCIAKDLI